MFPLCRLHLGSNITNRFESFLSFNFRLQDMFLQRLTNISTKLKMTFHNFQFRYMGQIYPSTLDCSPVPSKSTESPDWSSLPLDVLLQIVERLPVIDYVRCRAVCHSWKSGIIKHCSPAPQPPWLMLPSRLTHGQRTRAMLDLFSHNKEDCRIRMPIYTFFLGSSADGYLMLQDRFFNLLVMNPLTGLYIDFPSISTLFCSPPVPLVTSAALLRSTTATVVALVIVHKSGEWRLVFSRNGDEAWTQLACWKTPVDVIFYKGLLYVVNNRTNSIVTWDLGVSYPKSSILIPDGENEGEGDSLVRKFLVQSTCGHLLQIRTRNHEDYAVFKLDHSSTPPDWWRVMDLENDAVMLSDATIFPSGGAICVSARKFPELQGNCIYSAYRYDVIRVISLHGEMESCFRLCDDLHGPPAPHWFIPRLC